jgi:hypothetical protein
MHMPCEPERISDEDLKQAFAEGLGVKSKRPGDREEPPPPINPFVVIRYDAADVGARPAGSGAITYLSPDVLVTSLSGSPDILAGRPHLLQARLTNYGLFPATQIQVDFYWANPSMAITETAVNFIGSGTLPYLPAGTPAGPSSLLVACATDWVPRFENGGHECLLVRATIPTFDDAPVPLDPGLTYRVGQRNLTVVQVAPGQAFHIKIRAANTARFTLPMQVFGGRMNERLVKALLGTTAARRKDRAANTLQEGALSWKISAEEPPQPLPARSKLFAEQLMAQHDYPTGRTDQAVLLWEQALPALSEQTLTVQATIPQAARPGTIYSVALAETLGTICTGGYGLVLIVGER